ncbi:hypothetical protein ACW5WQ_21560 [Aeromonas rivuli]|uniref:hypothetical protein n=1 Tax=Aeromonas rivuli TaxID=648794 RepID=UPI0005AB1301|nr:hypothetical protein [Aeromonas rivuli]
MFKSKYLSGVAPAQFDQQVSDYIAKQPPSRGKTLITVIENEDGRVYRSIKTVGQDSFVGLVTFLRDELGLHDRLYYKPRQPSGKPDAHFQEKPVVEPLSERLKRYLRV